MQEEFAPDFISEDPFLNLEPEAEDEVEETADEEESDNTEEEEEEEL